MVEVEVVIGYYINGMEIYYRRFCGKGAPLGGYFVTIVIVIVSLYRSSSLPHDSYSYHAGAWLMMVTVTGDGVTVL